jgi:2-polyprenyl-3-methyl-5-hydroxy-6-metoxy-1,4-benzoquinol methylase
LYSGLADWLLDVPGTWEMQACRTCEAAWLDPQPVVEDIPKLYSRYYTHKAIPVTKFDGLRRAISLHVLARMGYPVESPRRWLPQLLSRIQPFARAAALDVMDLPASSRGTLLDVGCGNGELLARMQSLGWKVVGIEPDPSAVSFSRSRGLQVLPGMISDVPADERYDVITINHVIEHVSDPVGLLAECAKHLRPDGGRLIISTPNMKSLGHQMFGRYWRGLEVPRHLMLFSPRALCECIRQAGLRVNWIRTETRMARVIYNPSACAKAGEQRVGERTNFSAVTKTAAYLFQALEDMWIYLRKEAGEEIFVCAVLS